MKKVFLLIALAAFASISQADDKYIDATLTSKGLYREQVNGDWFVGATVGAHYYIGDHNRQGKFKDNVSGNFKVYGGYWFNAVCALRMDLQFTQARGLTDGNLWGNNPFSTGVVVKGRNGNLLHRQRYNFFDWDMDLMVNITQLLKGRATRQRYNCSPYLGFGWARVLDAPHNNSWAVNFGFYNTYRLTDHLDAVLELSSKVVSDRFDKEPGNRKGEAIVGVSLGACYNF